MLNEIMKKFPDLIQALLQKVSQSETIEIPIIKKAREKLIKQLSDTTKELSRLSQQPGEKLTKEQMKKIISIPREIPKLGKD